MLGSAPSAPPPPPPPPIPPTLATPSVAQSGAAERARLQAQEGAGFNGTDVTGGKGLPAPETTKTKSLLGQ